MTSKEILRNALDHKEGKVAVDFGGTGVTGIHCSVVEGLREYYGLEKKPVFVHDPYQMLGYIDEDLRQALGTDVMPILGRYDFFGMRYDGNPKEWKTPWGQTVLVADNFEVTEDKDGKVYFYAEGDTSYPPSGVMPKGGYFVDATPRQTWDIDDENLNVEDNLEEYNVLSDDTVAFFKKIAPQYKDSTYGLATETNATGLGDVSGIPGTSLKNPKGIRDVTAWYMALIENEDYIEEMFDRQTDIALENLKLYYEIFGDSIDVIKICGNDFGTQISTFCSPEKFRRLYKPYYLKMNDWVHSNTNWKVFKHSCGAIEPLIGELYEAGFDIINPVQWTATGMDPVKIKEKYGKDVTFWGGGINTQKTLPFGTPEEVREEALRHLEIFSKGGGYVFNTIHNLQAKVPVENVVALVNAVKEFNGDR